jgi:hypothetical protein
MSNNDELRTGRVVKREAAVACFKISTGSASTKWKRPLRCVAISKHHAVIAYKRRGCEALPHYKHLYLMEVNGQLHAPAVLQLW